MSILLCLRLPPFLPFNGHLDHVVLDVALQDTDARIGQANFQQRPFNIRKIRHKHFVHDCAQLDVLCQSQEVDAVQKIILADTPDLCRLLYIGQAVVAVPDDVDGLHDLAIVMREGIGPQLTHQHFFLIHRQFLASLKGLKYGPVSFRFWPAHGNSLPWSKSYCG